MSASSASKRFRDADDLGADNERVPSIFREDEEEEEYEEEEDVLREFEDYIKTPSFAEHVDDSRAVESKHAMNVDDYIKKIVEAGMEHANENNLWEAEPIYLEIDFKKKTYTSLNGNAITKFKYTEGRLRIEYERNPPNVAADSNSVISNTSTLCALGRTSVPTVSDILHIVCRTRELVKQRPSRNTYMEVSMCIRVEEDVRVKNTPVRRIADVFASAWHCESKGNATPYSLALKETLTKAMDSVDADENATKMFIENVFNRMKSNGPERFGLNLNLVKEMGEIESGEFVALGRRARANESLKKIEFEKKLSIPKQELKNLQESLKTKRALLDAALKDIKQLNGRRKSARSKKEANAGKDKKDADEIRETLDKMNKDFKNLGILSMIEDAQRSQ